LKYLTNIEMTSPIRFYTVIFKQQPGIRSSAW